MLIRCEDNPFALVVDTLIVLHKLGHIIGIYNEHTQPDKNEYIIDVICDNIIASHMTQCEDPFQQIPHSDSGILVLEIGCNYYSLMLL